MLLRNPTLKLTEPKRGKRVPKALTIEDLELLRDSCRNALEHALIECGLAERVSHHKMRHTLATVLINQGAPLVAVQSILGHEKPETAQLYATLSGSSRQQAYKRYFVQ